MVLEPENAGVTPLALYKAATAAAVPGPYAPDASEPTPYPAAARPVCSWATAWPVLCATS